MRSMGLALLTTHQNSEASWAAEALMLATDAGKVKALQAIRLTIPKLGILMPARQERQGRVFPNEESKESASLGIYLRGSDSHFLLVLRRILPELPRLTGACAGDFMPIMAAQPARSPDAHAWSAQLIMVLIVNRESLLWTIPSYGPKTHPSCIRDGLT
jgi:hypothetical protein